MKGQTQAVTAVMITGIVVATVTTAYVWGSPLVEKRQGQADLQNIESKALDIEEGIRSVSQSGTGNSEQIQVSLDDGNIDIEPGRNYLEFSYNAEGSNYPVSAWNLLRGQSRQGLSFGAEGYGIRGVNTPGVVAAKKDSESSSRVVYRIEFRNMRTNTPSGPELRLVDLQSSGSETASGDVTLDISNAGTVRDTGSDAVELDDGRNLSRTRNIVEIDFR